MNDSQARVRAEALREQIREHNHRYHVLSRPVVSDAEYDALMRELQRIEAEHPALVTPDSPTQRVGSPVSSLAKVRHSEPMLSLENAYDEDDIRAWVASLASFLKVEALPSELVAEPKLDGVSIEVVYRDGVLVQASTRGDGEVGEDVTHNVRAVASVPLKLRGESVPKLLEARGEAIMNRAAFEALNRSLLDAGEEPFANPRNLASGTLKQLDPKAGRSRPLEIVFYSVARAEGFDAADQWELLERLEALGLRTNRPWARKGGVEAAIAAYREYEERRASLEFEIDGIVIKVADMALRARLGTRSRSPRWAVAAKFKALQGATRVEHIDVQVGRRGTLTPVAWLEPVEVGGVTVTRATLHNAEQIRRLDVRIGDRVFIERAGDVIPKVSAVIKEARTGAERVFEMPANCPVCGTPAERDAEDAVALRCPNPRCPARVLGALEHFTGRGAVDLDGFGPKLLAQLVERGLVANAADLWTLKRDDLLQLERMGEKSADKLLASLEARKRPPLARFLFGLGIPHVGETLAELLAEHLGSLEALRAIGKDELAQMKGIGEEVASAVETWLADPGNAALLDRFRELGVAPVFERRPAAAGGFFAGKSVLFTGTLASQTRAEAEEQVARQGGRLLKSVSKNLDVLVAGAEPGSKLAKAQALGLRVMDEEEFLRLVR